MADYRYLNSYFYFFQLHLLSSYSHMYSVMLLLTFLFSPERTCASLGSLPLFHPIITPTAHLTTTLFYHLPTNTVQFLLTFSILYYRYNILSQDSHSKHHNYSARETSTSVFHIFLVRLINFISLQLLQLCRSPLFCDILVIMPHDEDNSQQSGWKKVAITQSKFRPRSGWNSLEKKRVYFLFHMTVLGILLDMLRCWVY